MMQSINRRGYHITYPTTGEVPPCPGCGRRHWHIGRILAECGFCATALPLVDGNSTGPGVIWRRGGDSLAAAA